MLPNRVGCIVNYEDLIEQNRFHIARQSRKGHLQEISKLACFLPGIQLVKAIHRNMPVSISLEGGLFDSGALYESCSAQ